MTSPDDDAVLQFDVDSLDVHRRIEVRGTPEHLAIVDGVHSRRFIGMASSLMPHR